MRIVRLAAMLVVIALGCLVAPTAAQAEAPPGRYCNVAIGQGTACLYGAYDARGWSAHYGPCGAWDVPSWLDPGNPWNGGVSSYVDNQTGRASVRGYWDNTVVWETINDNRLRNFPAAQNDKAWWVTVCNY